MESTSQGSARVLQFTARARRHGSGLGRLGNGFDTGGLSDRSLSNRPLCQGHVVENESAAGQGHEHVGHAQLNLFAGVRHLVAVPAASVCPLCEGITFSNGEREVESLEVHAASLPAGKQKSTPLGKLPSGNFMAMDLYARRRDNLRDLLKTFSAADIARASGVGASYISRALKEPGDKSYKTIGNTTATKIEDGARKLGVRKPEGWLDRIADAPAREAAPAVSLLAAAGYTEDDLALLADVKLILMDKEITELRERAAHVRRQRDHQAPTVANGAPPAAQPAAPPAAPTREGYLGAHRSNQKVGAR